MRQKAVCQQYLSTSAFAKTSGVAIEGEPVQSFDDLTTYLTRYTEVGDTVTLTVLRDGAEQPGHSCKR